MTGLTRITDPACYPPLAVCGQTLVLRRRPWLRSLARVTRAYVTGQDRSREALRRSLAARYDRAVLVPPRPSGGRAATPANGALVWQPWTAVVPSLTLRAAKRQPAGVLLGRWAAIGRGEPGKRSRAPWWAAEMSEARKMPRDRSGRCLTPDPYAAPAEGWEIDLLLGERQAGRRS